MSSLTATLLARSTKGDRALLADSVALLAASLLPWAIF
jgi:hypothetical protein